MSINIEDQLVTGMREETAGIAITTDILGAATRRHQRRTALQRTMYATGVIGLAGALAAVLAVGNGGQPGSGTNRPPVASAESPNLRLAAAITASGGTSYKVKVTVPYSEGVDTTEGAFDPTRATGYLNSTWSGAEVVYYERLVDGVRFVSSSGSKGWKQEPGRYDRLAYDRDSAGAAGDEVGATVDPQQLFEALRQSGAKVSQTGAGVYHFEVTLKPLVSERTSVDRALAGDVTLDGDKRIATITYQRTDRIVKDGQPSTSARDVTVKFSEYGAPVKVERPTDVVVVK